MAVEHDVRTRLGKGEITTPGEHAQLRQTEVQLDRVSDLLRQRQARREFDQDPADTTERPAETVENDRD